MLRKVLYGMTCCNVTQERKSGLHRPGVAAKCPYEGDAADLPDPHCLPSRDAQKDPDAPALLKHALGLLDDTLALWPNVPVKMSFLNRMLEGNLQQSLDPPPALLIGERALASMLSRYQLHCKSSVFQLQDDFARRQCFHRNSEDAEQADCLNCTIFPKHRVSVQAWR